MSVRSIEKKACCIWFFSLSLLLLVLLFAVFVVTLLEFVLFLVSFHRVIRNNLTNRICDVLYVAMQCAVASHSVLYPHFFLSLCMLSVCVNLLSMCVQRVYTLMRGEMHNSTRYV